MFPFFHLFVYYNFSEGQSYTFFCELFNCKSSCSARLSGGGWAEPKNGEAHFLAWVEYYKSQPQTINYNILVR